MRPPVVKGQRYPLTDIEQVYIEEKRFILLCILRRLSVTQRRCNMDVVTVERLDHLGIIAGVIKDVGIIEMIDARIVPDDQEDITTGEAVAGMILNGLGFSDRPMSLTPQ